MVTLDEELHIERGIEDVRVEKREGPRVGSR